MRWLRENWLDFLIFVLIAVVAVGVVLYLVCLLYTSPSPRDS